jgi:4,5-DOPA dioxygenase extradiol
VRRSFSELYPQQLQDYLGGHFAYPQADVPVVQLSIDDNQPPSFHYDIGQRLVPLCEDGIFIIGNLVHNLHAYAWGQHTVEPYDWVVSFERRVRGLLLSGETKALIEYENKLGKEAMLAVPTPDHYLPLLYVIGTQAESEPVSFPVEGVDGGSISMLAAQVG